MPHDTPATHPTPRNTTQHHATFRHYPTSPRALFQKFEPRQASLSTPKCWCAGISIHASSRAHVRYRAANALADFTGRRRQAAPRETRPAGAAREARVPLPHGPFAWAHIRAEHRRVSTSGMVTTLLRFSRAPLATLANTRPHATAHTTPPHLTPHVHQPHHTTNMHQTLHTCTTPWNTSP